MDDSRAEKSRVVDWRQFFRRRLLCHYKMSAKPVKHSSQKVPNFSLFYEDHSYIASCLISLDEYVITSSLICYFA